MGQAGGVGWSESSEVTPRSLDCFLAITGCHDQVVCGNQGEEAGLEERRERGVPGGEHSWAPVGERLTCLGPRRQGRWQERPDQGAWPTANAVYLLLLRWYPGPWAGCCESSP